MRVHLRFSEKDVDLCRWRHSIKKRMFTYYVKQILLSEMRGEIAYVPNSLNVSADDSPCNIFMNIPEADVEEFICSIPEQKRNITIKRIIRKQLQAQECRLDRNVVYQGDIQVKEPVKRKTSEPKKKQDVPEAPNVISQSSYTESEEDRDAILALIAMSGE